MSDLLKIILLLFPVPDPQLIAQYIPEAGETEFLIEDCINRMRNIDYDAMAYAFPRGAQVYSKAGYLHPSVFCFIRVPRKT